VEKTLSQQLKELIAKTDIDESPLVVADGARLLSEVRQWEEKGERLKRRISALEQSATSPTGESGATKSLADWAYEVLLDEGVAMPYREIAAVIKSRGFQHAREPKNPERQLPDSVWSAMYEDDRFTKVGRGIFDLTERL
jgi:HB1/ASXL restriction endonuclease-like protein with HTH domain